MTYSFIKHKAVSGFLFASLFCFFSAVSNAQDCNTNNYAAGKTVTASEEQGLAKNIVDGDLSTSWYTGTSGVKWLYVDLTQAYNLCMARLKWPFWVFVPDITIQGSNNASTWTDIGSIAAAGHGTHAPDNSYDYTDADLSAITTAYRYVRLYFPNSGSWGPHLKELEIYIKESVQFNVSLTAPANNSSFTQGNQITLTATASVTPGSINKVEFYADDTKLAEDLLPPYQYIWTNASAGSHTLVAKAYSNASQLEVSDPVTITVASPSGGWSLTGNLLTNNSNYLGTGDNKPFIIKTNGVERMRYTENGKIGFFTNVIPEGADVAINGNVFARKLRIEQTTWADFVFDKNYRLLTLQQVEAHIKKHHHLPGVPSAATVQKNGLDVGNGQALLLQKIEELTLYIIKQDKEIQKLKSKNGELEKIKNDIEIIKAKIQNY